MRRAKASLRYAFALQVSLAETMIKAPETGLYPVADAEGSLWEWFATATGDA